MAPALASALLLVVAAVVLVSAAPAPPASAGPARGAVFDAAVAQLAPTAPAFDLYVLAQSWQPEFCAGKPLPGCASPRPFWRSHFTLHGLWPERERGSPPSFCAGEPFDEKSVEEALGMDALVEFWPNVKAQEGTADYPGFWKHEWTRHGTCSGLKQVDFFAHAVALVRNESLAPTPELIQKNVGGSVSTTSLRAAFALPYGQEQPNDAGVTAAAALKCVHGDALSQVFTCWQKNAANEPVSRRTCPDHIIREDTCFKTAVRIPAFPNA